MIAAAEARGYEYYAVTDHAPNLVMQRMTDEKMLAQRVELRALADTTGMVLLHGSELNIAADGSVDWDADFLSGFDICVASVHSSFEQDRATMTKRFIAAAENPFVNVIGHPLTRKVGRRPPVQVDLGALYAACARTGTALEINASPDRMDLPPEHIAAAQGRRRPLRHRHRRALARRPDPYAVRGRGRPVRRLDQRRRDQRLAARPAGRIPAQRPLILRLLASSIDVADAAGAGATRKTHEEQR